MEGEHWRLNETIMNAEYVRAIDRIVAIGNTPNELLLLDPASESIERVAMCVGPGGWHSCGRWPRRLYFLRRLNVPGGRGIYDVPTEVYDVVLPENGWVYATPRTSVEAFMHCIELSTGNWTRNSGLRIYQSSK